MALYKNGVEYGMSFHLDGGGSGTPPTSLDNMTKSRTTYLNCDNTWLPYFGNTNGTYTIGAEHDTVEMYGATNLWDLFKNIWVEFDKPIEIGPNTGVTYSFANAEQVYLKNSSQVSGTALQHGSGVKFNNCRFLTLFDEDSSHYTWNAYLTHVGSLLPESNVISWVPNGILNFGETGATTAVIAANSVGTVDSNVNNSYKEIYVNQSLYTALQNDYYWMQSYNSKATPYDLSATEWLNNYFIIAQDGETIPWYQDSIENYYGKYIRLKSNNTTIAEIPYWSTQKLTTSIPINLTFNDVTRTGSVTVGETTKSYSLTQGACVRTISARMYFNTENGTYTKFSIWPFNSNEDIIFAIDIPDRGDSAISQLCYNQIKAIRYKSANSSTWSTYTLPNYFDLVQQAQSSTFSRAHQNLLLDISTTGYYDIQWMIIYDTRVTAQAVNYDGTLNSTIVNMINVNSAFYPRNFKCANNFSSYSEDTDIYDTTHPFMISADANGQVFDRGLVSGAANNNDDGQIMNYLYLAHDNTQYIQTLSVHDFTSIPYWLNSYNYFLTDLVLENCYPKSDFPGYGSFGDSVGNLTVWYANEKRVPSWYIVGCDDNYVKTIYLHPTIYSMTNHGFDDTVSGWESDRLTNFLNNGGHVYELPSDWKTRVPNYVGV